MAANTLTVDLAQIKESDAGTIDRIARLHCEAKRCGRELRIFNASDELLELIELCGLSRVLRVEAGR
jgi:ABC-type transporter Mla MlaB component